MHETTATDFESDVACALCASRQHEVLKRDVGWGCAFVRCRECSLMFYCPRMREEHVVAKFLSDGNAPGEADNLFDNGVLVGEPRGSPEEQKRILQEYYRGILGRQSACFAKHNRGRRPASMFEVGSSVGWYLKVARDVFLEYGTRADLAGCDANPFAARKARSGFGLDVREGTFGSYPSQAHQSEYYDLVTMLDYIEHTYTPRTDLEKLLDMTLPGGVLVLKTFLHELDPKGAYVHPVFHVHHFTEPTLRRTLRCAGWVIDEFDTQIERTLSLVTVLAHRPNKKRRFWMF